MLFHVCSVRQIDVALKAFLNSFIWFSKKSLHFASIEQLALLCYLLAGKRINGSMRRKMGSRKEKKKRKKKK